MGDEGVRRAICACGCCRCNMCGRTFVATKLTAQIPKRCSKRTGVVVSSRCRSKRSNSRPYKRCIACGRSGKRRGPRGSTSSHASRPSTGSSRVAREHPTARRRQAVPGVGVLTSTALVGAVGHIHAFRRGRQFASWLGLTPRESSTGSRRYLGRISKCGEVYLRCLLTQGARAVLLTAQRTVRSTPDRATTFQHWAVTLAARRGHNKAAIAVANKLARMIWAVWHHDVEFHEDARATVAA
jgi:Transposase IS116/IS110/IS902 family